MSQGGGSASGSSGADPEQPHRYSLKEQSLCTRLERYFRVRNGGFASWNRTTLDQRSGNTGCLGAEVEAWLDNDETKRKAPARTGSLTIGA